MTKEEAIKIIEYTFLNADGHLKPLDFDYGGGKGIVEALRMAIEALSQPSLPSNLDEAAEEYANRGISSNADPYEETIAYQADKDAFKAGAEWMAGQGETKETVIGMATEEISINVSQQTLDKLDLRPGDKVVVQIRKK